MVHSVVDMYGQKNTKSSPHNSPFPPNPKKISNAMLFPWREETSSKELDLDQSGRSSMNGSSGSSMFWSPSPQQNQQTLSGSMNTASFLKGLPSDLPFAFEPEESNNSNENNNNDHLSTSLRFENVQRAPMNNVFGQCSLPNLDYNHQSKILPNYEESPFSSRSEHRSLKKRLVKVPHHSQGSPTKTTPALDKSIRMKVNEKMYTPDEFEDLNLTDVVAGMSLKFPITNESRTVILRYGNERETHREATVEMLQSSGQTLATLRYDEEHAGRLLKDVDGNVIAYVIRRSDRDGHVRFKICGNRRLTPNQKRSKESGYYTWGEVKNGHGLGVKFSMKLRDEKETKFVTENFGPNIFQWTKQRGFAIKQGKDLCARVTNLGNVRGIVVGPNVDLFLMICFTAVVDEMMENRLR